jgi:serine/threonine-protein kinase
MNPKNFFAELKRRNVYKVAVAYAVIAWLLIQIATQIFPFFEIPNWAVRLIVLVIIIGFPIAMLIAWAFELTPEGLKRTESLDVRSTSSRSRVWIYVVVIAGAISVGLFFLGRFTAPKQRPELRSKSIAVLPFVDMSQAKDQEYFCDGISEEILDALAKVKDLRVVARTSSFSFKGKNADISEVANKLNVENVLEGSLRRNDKRIRITAQLIARDGFHLWSETYERELQDVFALQDEITRAIVDALKIKLAIAPPARAQPNTEAYDLYLQGLFFSNKSSEEALRKSLDLFQRALEKDPKLGHAWTGIAKAWDYLADAYVKPLEAYPADKAAASKALALDENDTEARCYLAESNRVLDWNLAAAHAEISRALRSEPNSATAHLYFANVLVPEGEWEQALVHARQAVKLDPLSSNVADGASSHCFQTRRYDEAIAEGRRAQLLDPGYLYRDSPLAAAYTGKGMYAEALAVYQKIQQAGGGPLGGLAITYAKMGRTDEARGIAGELKKIAETRYFAAEPIALIYAALGETDEAFKWLDRAAREHSARLQAVVFAPELRPLHSDPRFQNLLRRIGVDPAKVLARDKTP